MPYQRRTFESRIDYSLILPVLMLLSIGVVAIYIAVGVLHFNEVAVGMAHRALRDDLV